MIDRKLLDKFYKGRCTPDEVQQVLSWFKNQNQGEQNIEEYWHVFEQQYDTKLAVRKPIPSAPNHQKPSLIWQNQWVRVAAVLLLAFSLTLLWATLNQQLTSTAPVAIEIIEKITPTGQKMTFQLPDGSLVTLNAESRLAYPERFDGSNREVVLTGEAFFDVTSNPTCPFTVSARGVNTQALGTSFNIRAYQNEPTVEVVLATGKVKVDFTEDQARVAYLIPGEKIIANNQELSLQKSEANLAYALDWKDNILHFQEATSEEVIATLERWYGVKIFSPKLARINDWQFSGTFQNENLENVLTSIGYAKNFQFKIQSKSVTITY